MDPSYSNTPTKVAPYSTKNLDTKYPMIPKDY